MRPKASSARRAVARATTGLLASVAALTMALTVGPVTGAFASTTTLNSPTTLTGNQSLSSTGVTLTDPGSGLSASFDLTESLSWSQPAQITAAFDPNLVRQGRFVSPSDSYSTAGAGTMSVTWTLNNLSVSWDGIGPLDLGSPGFSATGSCNLMASGPNYDCNLLSDTIPILPAPYGYIGPYVNMGLGADVTITPQQLATMRQAAFAGTPDGTADLNLSETPVTDQLQVPCTVGAGDDLSYTLGSLSANDAVNVVNQLVFDVGGAFPTPVPGVEATVQFASPTVNLSTIDSSIAMSGPGATFDFGNVLHNNIPPTAATATSYSGNEGAPITFDGSGSSSICGAPVLQWNFSDGGIAYGPTPQHTFQGPGVYSGLLTATDVTGLTNSTTFSVTVADVPPVVDAGPAVGSAWGVPVTFNGGAVDPGSDLQPTLSYAWDFGDGTPSASGGPSVTHSYSTPGTYTATLTVCDKFGMCSSSSTSATIRKRDVTASYTGNFSGTYNTPSSLNASLSDEFGNPVQGRTVTFTYGGAPAGSASTNSSGNAATAFTPMLGAGTYPVTVGFSGDSLYQAASAGGSYVEALKATSVAYTGALSGGPNKTVTLSAVLTDATGLPLAGRTITFTLGTQTVTAVTNANGVATTALKLNQKNGTYGLAATFAPSGGDAGLYTGSSAAATFSLQSK